MRDDNTVGEYTDHESSLFMSGMRAYALSTDPGRIRRRCSMKPVTVINRLVIKPGKMQEFLQVQQAFVGSLTAKPRGLIASRTYRSIDDESVVLMSLFVSVVVLVSLFCLVVFLLLVVLLWV